MTTHVVVLHVADTERDALAHYVAHNTPPNTTVYSFDSCIASLFTHDSSLQAFVDEKIRLHDANAQENVLGWPDVISCARVQSFIHAFQREFMRDAPLPFTFSHWSRPPCHLVPWFQRGGTVGADRYVLIVHIEYMEAAVRRLLLEYLVCMATASTAPVCVHHGIWYANNAESQSMVQQTGVPILPLGNVHLLLQVHNGDAFCAWLTDMLVRDLMWNDDAFDYVHDGDAYRLRSDRLLSHWCAPADAYTQLAVVHAIRELTGIPRDFCGAQPCNMSQENAAMLEQHVYMCALKVDGERFLWLVHGGSVYALSRNFCVTEVGHHERLTLLHRTVLDVEHVPLEKYHWRGAPSDAVYERNDVTRNERGLVVLLDAIVFMDKPCANRSLHERMERVRWALPYFQTHKLHVIPQEYVPARQGPRMLVEGRMFRYCACDGMILVRPDAPYKAGYQRDFIKWKPRVENTIDALVEQHEDETLLLTVADNNVDYDVFLRLQPPQRELPDGAIMEMSYDTHRRAWCSTRERCDKRMPNATWVARNIMATFGQEVHQEQLCALLHANNKAQQQQDHRTLFERARTQRAKRR